MASGMRNTRIALINKIKKCPVAEKKPDGAVEKDSSSFFVASLPSLCRVFINM